MKILYNVTVKVEIEVHLQWLNWMKRVHIPEVMATGKFEEYKICRLMGVDEVDGITYAIQYLCPNMVTFQLYQEKDAYRLQKVHYQKFNDQFVAFRTVMQVIEEFKST